MRGSNYTNIALQNQSIDALNGLNVTGAFQVENDEAVALTFGQHTTDIQSSEIVLRKSRGTQASPTIVSSGDALGQFIAQGWDGNNYERIFKKRI